jgi:hypothetical protein
MPESVVKEDLEMKRHWWACGAGSSILAALETVLLWAAWAGGSPARVYAQGQPTCPPTPGYETWSPCCDVSPGCTPGSAPEAGPVPA